MASVLEKKVVFPLPGKYVVAVSGGVDSVSLLNLLHHKSKLSKVEPWKLIVAHLDHGMRVDSAKDCELVAKLARKLKLEFVSKKARLGPKASEATARKVRYTFLQSVMKKYKAAGIITAHHTDDLLETAIFNSVRGTYSLGLTPFSDDSVIKRPFINVAKEQIVKYAKANKLQWHEDSTNQDLQISRNYIRYWLLPNLEKLQPGSKKLLFKGLSEITAQNLKKIKQTQTQLNQCASFKPKQATLDRSGFLCLAIDESRNVIYKLMQSLLPDVELNKTNILTAEHFAKTAKTAKKLQISQQLQITSQRDTVVFALHNRA